MQEYRWGQLHDRWVIVAAKRAWRPGLRPRAAAEAGAPSGTNPDFEAGCPFCAGNESETPAPLLVDRGASLREDEPWRVRVVPNLFEAASMSFEETAAWEAPEPFATRPARGMHEVIIETPRHGEILSAMPVDHLASVLAVFQMRIQAAHGAGLASALIFRNAGAGAGASLAHPHSQMLALPWIPPALVTEQKALQAGHCFLCEAWRRERGGVRPVFETEHYWTWIPPAGALPYEMLLLPRKHEASFPAVPADRLPELAEALRRAWGGLRAVLGDVPMNLVLHTAPFAPGGDFHWHIELLPRTTQQAGFELGSGSFINPSSPEDAAARLRGALAALSDARRN